MKSTTSYTNLSANKLLNKKLSVSSNTPKYVQSKIYISTKQLNNVNQGSLSKTINNKLDLIKQQISRQFQEHYHKNIIKNSTSKYSQQGQKVSKSKQSKSRDKRNKIISQSISKLISPNKSMSNSRTRLNSTKPIQSQTIYQSSALQPKRLFENYENLKKNQEEQSQKSRYVSSSLFTNNNNLKDKQDYKQKYLLLNEKYLDQKQKLISLQEISLKLKSNPNEIAAKTLIHNLISVSQINSKLNYNDLQDTMQNFYQNAQSSSQSPFTKQLQQNLMYILACYQDIQQFKTQLQYMLQLTSTKSLEELKQFLQLLSQKQNGNGFSNDNKKNSYDQCAYKILQLQSNNNRLKQEYQKMISDIKQKYQLEILSQKEERKIDMENFNKLIKNLEDQNINKVKEYHELLFNLNQLVDYYYDSINITSQFNAKNSSIAKRIQNHNLSSPSIKDKKISQFKPDLVKQSTFKKSRSNQFIRKYNQTFLIHQSISSEIQQNNQIDYQRPPSIQYHFHNGFPKQISQIDSLLQQLTNKLAEYRHQTQDTKQKFLQANQAIIKLDQKMQQIKNQMQDQLHEEQLKLQQKQKQLQNQQGLINNLKYNLLKYEAEIKLKNQQLNDKHQQSIRNKIKLEQLEQNVLTLKQKCRNYQIQRKSLDQNYLLKSLQIQQKFENFIKNLQNNYISGSNINIKNTSLNINDLNQQSTVKQIKQFKNFQLFQQQQPKNTKKQNYYQKIISSIFQSFNKIIQKKFIQLTSLFNSSQISNKNYHKQVIQKQKQNFELIQKLKNYQKNIINKQNQLNNAIIDKQQYQYLLNQLRKQYNNYKKQVQIENKKIQRKKDEQLLKSNRIILQANSKLTHENVQLKDQNIRLSKQLQDKINQKTFFKRKVNQNQTLLQEKDKRILELQKQTNKLKTYLSQIQDSFNSFVKNQQISSQKIINLQTQKLSITQQISKLQSLNKLLQSENNKYHDKNNLFTTQNQKLNKKIKQLLDIKENYEQINIELRMKTIEIQQKYDNLQEKFKNLQINSNEQKKIKQKISKHNNQLLFKIQQTTNKKQQFYQMYLQSQKTHNDLLKTINIKQNTIQNLQSQIQQSTQQIKSNNIQLQEIRQQLIELKIKKDNKQKQQNNKSKNIISSKVSILQQEDSSILSKNQISKISYNESYQKQKQLSLKQIKRLQNNLKDQNQCIQSQKIQINDEYKKLNQNKKLIQQKLNQIQLIEEQLQQKQHQLQQNKEQIQKIFKKNKEQIQKLNNREKSLIGKQQKLLIKQNQLQLRQIDLINKQSQIQRKINKENNQKQQKQQISKINTHSKLHIQSNTFYLQLYFNKQKQQNSNFQKLLLQQQINIEQNILSNYLKHTSLQQNQNKQLEDQEKQQQLLIDDINQNQLQNTQQINIQLQQNSVQLKTPLKEEIPQSNNQFQTFSNLNNVGCLYSTPYLNSNPSLTQIDKKSYDQWIKQINFILISLSKKNSQEQSIQKLPYYIQIKQNFFKIKSQVRRALPALQLDYSMIQSKQSVSSPSSVSFYKDFLTTNRNVLPNQNNENGQKSILKNQITNKIKKDDDNLSECSNVKGTGRQFIDHLKEINSLLQLKLRQCQQNYETLKNQYLQLQQKLVILQNQTSIQALENIFKQLTDAYLKQNIDKFQQTFRLLMKVLKYSQREMQLFAIQIQKRKKKKKQGGFFSSLIK